MNKRIYVSDATIQTDSFLQETTRHGTKTNPVTGIHFQTGQGTMYPDHFFVGRHWHHTVEIVFVIKGKYKFEINLEHYELAEGDLCFLNSGDLHQISGLVPDTEHDVFIFDPHILEFSYPDELQDEIIAPFLNHVLVFPHVFHPWESRYESLITLIRELMDCAQKRNTDWYIRCKLLLLKMFYKMAKENRFLSAQNSLSSGDRQKISRYKKVVTYIEEHYFESITLDQLAGIIGVNSQYFCRFFREITGNSPIQYLISYRIEQACAMLTDTTKTILEISLDCGFDNVSYFIRKFKQLKQCTPSAYRRSFHSR